MILEPCACGATDCRRCYPLSWKEKDETEQTEFYLDLALEKAVETIISHGQYPARGRAKFDLYDFLLENRDPSYILELFITALSNNKQDLLNHAGRERKIVKNLLLKHLMDSEFVAEIAAEYAEDDL